MPTVAVPVVHESVMPQEFGLLLDVELLIAAVEPAMPVSVAKALAVETSDGWERGSSAGVGFDPTVRLSKLHFAICDLVVQDDGGEGKELTINASEPELPVSVVSIKRWPVVLL